jgi:outer membrane protein assembly factor BamE (lipoprotein component of BamABCDE complex)
MRMSAAALALLLTACSTTTNTGRMPDADKVAQLQPGTTTVASARALLGEPFQTVAGSDGTTILTYAHTQVQQHGVLASSSDVASRTLVLIFDAQGKLVRSANGATNATVK